MRSWGARRVSLALEQSRSHSASLKETLTTWIWRARCQYASASAAAGMAIPAAITPHLEQVTSWLVALIVLIVTVWGVVSVGMSLSFFDFGAWTRSEERRVGEEGSAWGGRRGGREE